LTAALVLVAIAAAPGPAWAAARGAKGTQVAAVASGRDPVDLSSISTVAEREVAAGHVPGAVIALGHEGRLVALQAFGHRVLAPAPAAMTPDTVFDLASLTKVVATAPAVLRLVDEGRLDLDAPAARYWPDFGANGKALITIRDLLTHFSGLAVGLDPRAGWDGEAGALAAIAAGKPVGPRGLRFSYSDEDFIVLGEIVRRVSGMPLDIYCSRMLFGPLGMTDTGFRPGPALRGRIAPSDTAASWLPQDPVARRMGGVAGHAGLFGTAADLARFARMILGGGELDGVRVLSERAVTLMTSVQSPAAQDILRGLGWDIRSPFSVDHTASFPDGSFGHTGYTGTSIWIDPPSGSFLIILANRLHPDGKGQVRSLRAGAAAAFARAFSLPAPGLAPETQVAGLPAADSPATPHGQADSGVAEAAMLRTGIDVLEDTRFAQLAGHRVGLLTNQTGRDSLGRRTADVLARAPGVTLAALFTPEHGMEGVRDEEVGNGIDAATGLPVFSLYGEHTKPTPDMLRGVDMMVVDLQDVGARFYTYATSMAYVLEACAKAGIPVVVLDRPNPIKASVVQGPVLDAALKSFTGYFPMPTRHGMTMGELARLFNFAAPIGADLRVVAMTHYARDAWYDATGLPWVAPSPNLRSVLQAALYPGVAMVEGANVSVGRGTPSPFELVGAPWIDAARLARSLADRGVPGLRFVATDFTPVAGPFRNEICHGVRIEVLDRDALDSPRLGLELVAALHRMAPDRFQIDRTLGMVGSRAVLEALKRGEAPDDALRMTAPSLAAFARLRHRALLY
jgi:uncharacterized protein YbbC (DUF1343 family)/CubicO group peptidase (beta-lactamase class C family)